MFIGAPVSAEVVDSFTCRLEYLNAQGEMQEASVGQLTATRREMEREDLWGRNIRFTEAQTDWIEFEFSVEGEIFRYYAKLKLHYFHAIELDSAGRAVRAAQQRCHQRNIHVPNKLVADRCNPHWFEDPFSGEAWNAVEIAPNGIAQFDISSFPRGIGSLDIHCELVSSEDRSLW